MAAMKPLRIEEWFSKSLYAFETFQEQDDSVQITHRAPRENIPIAKNFCFLFIWILPICKAG